MTVRKWFKKTRSTCHHIETDNTCGVPKRRRPEIKRNKVCKHICNNRISRSAASAGYQGLVIRTRFCQSGWCRDCNPFYAKCCQNDFPVLQFGRICGFYGRPAVLMAWCRHKTTLKLEFPKSPFPLNSPAKRLNSSILPRSQTGPRAASK